jgi:hypothetical protein
MPTVKWGLLAAVLITVLPACGGGSGGKLEACSVVFADGTRTGDLDHQPRCIGKSGAPEHIASHRWLCTDGRELFVNDYGYGAKDDPWQVDIQVIEQRLGTRGPGTPDPATRFGRVVAACQR